MRLGMGELTSQELGQAQYAAHQALDFLSQERGWVVVPRQPSPSLLTSMALRLDHGLDAPFSKEGGASPDQRTQKTLALAAQAYDLITGSVNMGAVRSHVDRVCQQVSGEHESLPRARLALSAARYALTNMERYGLALAPQSLPEDAKCRLVNLLSGSHPDSKPSPGAAGAYGADAVRLLEEVVGQGLHRPAPSRSSPSL